MYMDEQMNNGSRKAAKILAIVAMVSAFLAVFLAIIFDIIAFREVILQFVAALILPIIAFVVLCIAMIASFIMIFGIFLVKDYGFWPLTLSIEFFKQILADIKVSQEAIQTFAMFRFVLIGICVTIMALAIVSKVLFDGQEEQCAADGKKRKKKNGIMRMSTTAIVFSVLGLIVSSVALIIVGQI